MALGLVGGLAAAESLFNLGSGIWNNRYQKNLQQQIFQREDNAVQRRAADLEAAGLSKTLAAGSAASSGSVVSVDAPQFDAVSKLSTAMQIRKQEADIANVNAQTENELLRGDQMKVQTDNMRRQGALIDAQTLLTTGNASLIGLKAEQAQAMIDKAKAETESVLLKQGLTRQEIDNLYQDYKLKTQQATMNAIQQENARRYGDVLEAQLSGVLLDNIMKHSEADYMVSTGMKMGNGGIIGQTSGALGTMATNAWDAISGVFK